VTLPDFDYHAKPQVKLEIPLAERIAEIRARKAQDRERAKINAARKEAAARRPQGQAGRGGQGGHAGPGVGGDGGGSRRRRGPRRPGAAGREDSTAHCEERSDEAIP
jgi:ATP-dependent RNA helicase RhlE